ncbi:MAG: type II toxin-antitoxin system VapC family toxin [Alphaproteobacteria bacterium]
MKPSFVLDCSVTMAWCFEDETCDYTEAVLASFESAHALVPLVWSLEVTNVLLIAGRTQRLQEADMLHFVNLLHGLSIVTEENPIMMKDLILLGKLHQLTSYDASYLHTALTNGLPIATLDKKLKLAAKQAGVPLYLVKGS